MKDFGYCVWYIPENGPYIDLQMALHLTLQLNTV